MEMLAVWMVCVVVRERLPGSVPWSFTQCWLLQGVAAVVAWRVGSFQLPSLWQPLLLLAVGTCLVVGFVALPLGGPSQSEPARLVFSWLIASYLCVRGLFAGLRAGGAGAVLRWFRLGGGWVVLWSAFLALSDTPAAELPMRELHGLCLGYFVFGATLAGLDQRRATLALAGQTPILSPAALLAIVGPVAACAALALVPELGGQEARWAMRRASAGLSALEHWVLELLSLLGLFLRWLSSLWWTRNTEHPAPPGIELPKHSGDPLVQMQPIKAYGDGHEALVVVVIALAVILLVYLWSVASRRRDRAPASDDSTLVDEDRSSTWSWDLLLQPWHALQARLAQLRSSEARRSLRPRSLQSLRDVYCALLVWAAERGEPRGASHTAREFGARLAGRLPSKRRQLAQLEEYYAIERYAERRATRGQLEHARALLDEVTNPQQSSESSS